MPLDLGTTLPEAALVELKLALRAVIVDSGRTQEDLERATGIDQSRISRIINETNVKQRPTLADVLKIEAACGVAPGYVLAAAGLTSIEGTEAGARARVAGARRDTGRSS